MRLGTPPPGTAPPGRPREAAAAGSVARSRAGGGAGGCARPPSPRGGARSGPIVDGQRDSGAKRGRVGMCASGGRAGGLCESRTRWPVASSEGIVRRSGRPVLGRQPNRQALAPFLAPLAEHFAAPARAHPRPESMLADPFPVPRPIGRLHGLSPCVGAEAIGARGPGSRLTFPQANTTIGRPVTTPSVLTTADGFVSQRGVDASAGRSAT